MILKNKRRIIIIVAVIIIGVLLIYGFYNITNFYGKPQIYLKAPKTLQSMSSEKFNVDVVLSDFPENSSYPAASISIKFDRNKLQFLGVQQGTMMTGDEKKTNTNMEIPVWSCNPEISNQNGIINSMYLDMTAGDNAYRFYGFHNKNKNVLLRLSFALRDSASKGEKLHLNFSDAVMASISDKNKNKSLSTLEKSLRFKDSIITIK